MPRPLSSTATRRSKKGKQQHPSSSPPSNFSKCQLKGILRFGIHSVLFMIFAIQLANQGPKLMYNSRAWWEGVGRGGSTSNIISANQEEEQTPNVVADPDGNNKTCLSLQLGDQIGHASHRSIKPENRYTPDPLLEPRKCQIYTEPSPYIDLLLKALVGFPNQGTEGSANNKVDPIKRKYGLDWPKFGYTMVGTARLENFRAAIEEVNRNEIPGAIMELGVWRGGAMIMAAAVQKEYNNNVAKTNNAKYMDREFFVLDAFEVIPKTAYGGAANYLFNTQADVVENFKLFNVYDENKVHFVKGLFKDTVPQIANTFRQLSPSSSSNSSAPLLDNNANTTTTTTTTQQKQQQIAVLRVDGNFYDSYQDSLYYLYDKVPVGGIVIFDDVMSHPPVMRCWLDFKQDHNITEQLNRIDTHSAWFRKEKLVEIDMSKMRPPQDLNKQQ